MMGQFEVLTINDGVRYLTEIDTSRYDAFIGFRRIVKTLPAVDLEAEEDRAILQLAEYYGYD